MSNLAICNYAYEGKINLAIDCIKKDEALLLKKDTAGRTVVHWAASGGYCDLVKFCHDLGGDIQETDDSGWTPLMIGVSAGRDDVVNYLLEKAPGCVTAANSTGQTALHYAASKNRLQMVASLLSAGARPNAADSSGATPLHRAVSLAHRDVVLALLQASVTATTTTTTTTTAAAAAASGELLNGDQGGHVATSELPNMCDSIGQTPMHYACEEGDMQLVRLLHQYGGRLDIKDREERTPLDLASPVFRVKISKLCSGTSATPTPPE